jgi:hypothetical protein
VEDGLFYLVIRRAGFCGWLDALNRDETFLALVVPIELLILFQGRVISQMACKVSTPKIGQGVEKVGSVQ